MTIFQNYIEQYGNLAVLIGSAIDHTGTPTVIIIAGTVASTGLLSIKTVIVLATIGGFIGDLLFYIAGRFLGRPLIGNYQRKLRIDSDYVNKAEEMINRYSFSIVVWGRFMAVVSRYIPLACGIVKMRFGYFVFFSLLGNTLINLVYGIPAYYLGERLSVRLNNEWFAMYVSIFIVLIHFGITGAYMLGKARRNSTPSPG